jgi:hypothetical protein
MRGRRGERPQAQRADKYELYEKAVQMPDVDAALVERVFRNRYQFMPRTLREDFCGTAAFACEWVRRRANHRAWAIDLDPVPLESGRRRHVAALAPDQAARLELIQGDVLEVRHQPVDVSVAFNFCYVLVRTRAVVRRYFD